MVLRNISSSDSTNGTRYAYPFNDYNGDLLTRITFLVWVLEHANLVTSLNMEYHFLERYTPLPYQLLVLFWVPRVVLHLAMLSNCMPYLLKWLTWGRVAT